MSLEKLQLDFARYVLGPGGRPEGLLKKVMPAGRLPLYRQLAWGSLQMAFNSVYPFTRRVLGADAWERVQSQFFGSNPPHHWDLNQTTLDLPTWLEENFLPRWRGLPAWAAYLADYEQLEMLTLQAPDLPWEQGKLNPTLILRNWPWDIATWVKAGQGEEPPLKQETITIVYRDPFTLYPSFLKINTLTGVVIQALEADQDETAICRQLCEVLGITPEVCEPQLRDLFQFMRLHHLLR